MSWLSGPHSPWPLTASPNLINGYFVRTTNKCVAIIVVAACGRAGAPDQPRDVDASAVSVQSDGPPTSSPADAAPPLPTQTERLRIVNTCTQPIWVAHSSNVGATQNIKLATGEFHDYAIPAGGLASARFWPKVGCDASGHNCSIGDNGEGGGAPCGPNGCQPPIDSKFEVTFAATGSSAATFYNLSLVDGYTLPFSVTPIGPGVGVGSCTVSDCSGLTLDACPTAEDLGGSVYPAYADRDLRMGNVGCMAPCKKWRYPAPYGMDLAESQDPGLHLCCPTPIDPATGQCTIAHGCMTADACRATSDPLSVTHTEYVQRIHARCPTAYAYSYDDAAGLHACSADTGFRVVFCP